MSSLLLTDGYKIDHRRQYSNNTTLVLSTNEKIIVKASPVDPIWGIGMASDHKDSNNPEKWVGLNLLGFALMEVKDEFN